MRETILAELARIEQAEQVRVLYACESGSRAWGFASPDSDYDVRFIYVRPLRWYLSIFEGRDTLEAQIDGGLDMAGWDMKKALGLMLKSNPALYEWLGSPIIYQECPALIDEMRRMAERFYRPAPASYHYYHMAKGNYERYLMGEEVWTKKYFYVLRPLLAIKWIQAGLGVVPTEFQTLLDRFLPPTLPPRDEVDQLLADKRNGDELRRGPRVEALDDYLAGNLEAWRDYRFENVPSDGNITELNQFFQLSLGAY